MFSTLRELEHRTTQTPYFLLQSSWSEANIGGLPHPTEMSCNRVAPQASKSLRTISTGADRKGGPSVSEIHALNFPNTEDLALYEALNRALATLMFFAAVTSHIYVA